MHHLIGCDVALLDITPSPSDLDQKRIIWTLRSCARRERSYEAEDRRLTDPDGRTWRSFAGRLHEGDYVSMLVENNAQRNALALRPLFNSLDPETGNFLLNGALKIDRSLLNASSATFLEAASVAFGKQPLDASRRAAFDAIRATDQRILEFPSTAGRVTSMVAAPGAPLDTYVGYVVENDDDIFLVGLTMLEFDRNATPTLLWRESLERGDLSGIGTFSRGVTLGGDDDLIALIPSTLLAHDRITRL